MKIILCITYTGFQYENLKSQDTVAPIKVQAGVMAVMTVANTAQFDIDRVDEVL